MKNGQDFIWVLLAPHLTNILILNWVLVFQIFTALDLTLTLFWDLSIKVYQHNYSLILFIIVFMVFSPTSCRLYEAPRRLTQRIFCSKFLLLRSSYQFLTYSEPWTLSKTAWRQKMRGPFQFFYRPRIFFVVLRCRIRSLTDIGCHSTSATEMPGILFAWHCFSI